MSDITKSIQILIDDTAAGKSLDNLNKKVVSLRTEIDKLDKSANTYAQNQAKLQTDLKKTENQIEKYNKGLEDTRNILDSLSGTAYNEFIKIQRVLQKELNNSTRGTKEYMEACKALITVEKELAKVKADMNTQFGANNNVLKQIFSSSNQFFEKIVNGIDILITLDKTIKNLSKDYAEYDDKLADVMKTTNLSKEEVVELSNILKTIDTRASQLELLELARVAGELGLTEALDIEGFVRASDKIGLALKEDLGGDIEEAVSSISKLTELFNVKDRYGIEDGMIRIGSAINELGTATTVNEEHIINFTEKVGNIASQSKISIQNTMGLGAAMDALGQSAEISGTMFSEIVATMYQKTDKYASIAGMSVEQFSSLLKNDANEAFLKVMDGVDGSNERMQQMIGLLGDMEISGSDAAEILVSMSSNIGLIREQQDLANIAFMENISLLNDAEIKNNTAQAQLEKNQQVIQNFRVELGERLQPIMGASINITAKLLKGLLVIIDTFKDYGVALLAAGTAIGIYTLLVKKNIIMYELYCFWNIQVANTFKKLWTTISKNPLGVVLSVASAALALFMKFRNQISDTNSEVTDYQKSLSDMADVSKKASENSVKERIELDQVFERLKNTNAGSKERLKLIDETNAKYGTTLKNLSDEKEWLDQLGASYSSLLKQIEQKSLLDALNESNIEITKEVENIKRELESGYDLDERSEKKSGIGNFFRKLASGIARGFDPSLVGTVFEDTLDKESERWEKKLNQKLEDAEKTQGKVRQQIASLLNSSNTNSTTKATKTEDEEKWSLDKTIFDERQNILLQYYDGEIKTTKERDRKILELEIKAIEERQKVVAKDSEEYLSLKFQLAERVFKLNETSYSKQIDKIIESTRTEREIENDNYEQRLKDAELFLEDKNNWTKKQNDAYEILVAEHKEKLEDIDKKSNDKLIRDASEKIAEIEDKRKIDLQNLEYYHTRGLVSEEDYQKELINIDYEYWQKKLQVENIGQKDLQNLRNQYLQNLDAAIKSGDTNNVDAFFDDYKKHLEEFYKTAEEYRLNIAGGGVGDEYMAELEKLASFLGIQSDELQVLANAEIDINQMKNDALLASDEESEAAKRKIRKAAYKQGLEDAESYIKESQAIVNALSDFIAAKHAQEEADLELKYQKELADAGDNAEERTRIEEKFEKDKFELQKKQADANFAVQVAQIISAGALAVVQALAQLGPIAGPIAAGLIAATVAMQISVANKQRQAVKASTFQSAASSSNISESSEQTANTTPSGERKATGYKDGGYTGPGKTTDIAGPVHRGEYVTPSFVLRTPEGFNHVKALEAIRVNQLGISSSTLPGFFSGGYTGNPYSLNSTGSITYEISTETKALLADMNNLLHKLNQSGVNAFVVYDELERKRKQLEASKLRGSL